MTSGTTNPSCSLSNNNVSFSAVSCSYNNATKVLSIPSFTTFSIPGNTTLSIKISNTFINPISSKPTTEFKITTFSPANYSVDTNTTATYHSIPGIIQNLTITSSSPQVRSLSNYTLFYNLTRPLPTNATI